MKKNKQEKQSVNSYINVADIKGNVLYTKDNYIISFLKLSTISITTMSKTDIRILIKTLCNEFASINTNIRLFKISKPIDISNLINLYREMYKNSIDLKQKELLRGATFHLHKYSTNESELENHHYMIIREKFTGNTLELEKKSNEIARKFNSAKIGVEICSNEEIARLCNLFVNPSYASVENMNLDESVSIINDFVGGNTFEN